MTFVADETALAPAQPRAVNPTSRGEAVNFTAIEQLLTLAVERGVDPAALEKLVALHERMTKLRGESEFNLAVQRFQSRCPVIGHNQEADAGKYKYTYADLSHIAKTIQPILDDCGLSYSFDSAFDNNRIKTTCTVHHVAGHSRSAHFEATIDGPSAMSGLHKSASTLTYCRRYALTLALGLTTSDADDDGQGIPKRQETPPANPESPRVPTRAERKAAPKSPMATAVNSLFEIWKGRFGSANSKPADFFAWAAKELKTDQDMTNLANWTIDCLDVCREALK